MCRVCPQGQESETLHSNVERTLGARQLGPVDVDESEKIDASPSPFLTIILMWDTFTEVASSAWRASRTTRRDQGAKTADGDGYN